MNSQTIKLSQKYKVQNNDNNYRITIPKKFISTYDIEDVSKLGIKVNTDNGFGVINYMVSFTDEMIHREITSNNTIRIPSSIGNSLIRDNLLVNWSAKKYESNILLSIKTKNKLHSFNTCNMKLLKKHCIKPVKQLRKQKSGETKHQEHFDIYLSEKQKNLLSWTNDISLEIGFVIVDNDISLQIKPSKSKYSKNVTMLGEDMRIYIPKSLIRSLNMLNENVSLVYKNNSIFFKRP